MCNFNEYSDHAPLHVELAVSYLYPQVENNELSTGKVREVYHWNANLAPQCREAVRVNLDKIHTSFNEAEIVSQATMNSNIDNFTSVLSGIFTPFCKSYATRSRTPDGNIHTFDVNISSRNVPDKPWFNDELKRYYREYKRALNQFNSSKTTEHHTFLNEKKRKYKFLEAKRKRYYLRTEGDMLAHLKKT